MQVRTSVVPDLIDALVAAATTPVKALGARTVDGYGIDVLGDALHIGVDDPFSSLRATSAETGETAAAAATTRPRQETGTIRCSAWCRDGDPAQQKKVRDNVYAIAGTVATLVRGASGPGIPTPAFGVTGLTDVSYGTASQFYQNQTKNGAEALLVFDIYFTARI